MLTNTKNPRQIAAANPCGKFSRQIAMANSCGKFSKQIATASSCGKFPRQILRQILATNSHGKFSRRGPTANSRICKAEDGVEYPLCGRASQVKIKRKQITKQKFIKA